ncbi:hypothetical protein TNCV_4830461 [Trichonephila clavipes]|nr:hypothetical protein TNCV_4830461 [Trichonephila clavipes]
MAIGNGHCINETWSSEEDGHLSWTYYPSFYTTPTRTLSATTELTCISPFTLRVSERENINVALFSNTRAFGDGPRNFEPWSSDVDDI